MTTASFPSPRENLEAAIPREETNSEPENGPTAVPYMETQFSDPLMSREIYELTPAELDRIVTRVVEAEGPIHADEIARRVTFLWGMQRAGNRIAKAVNRALMHAIHDGKLDETAGFYSRFGQREFPARNRENVASSNLRRPEMLPPQELDAAIVEFVAAHISATPDETARAVARLLGFRSTSQQLKSRIDSRMDFLVSAQRLITDRGVLRMGEAIAIEQ